ncbi:MAG: hypothetical protein JO122_14515 [Acetobacteraceae bacterium]|nr:hypothetical protein [Acetobacteraceae bacterium]
MIEFGSFAGVLSAPITSLHRIKGIEENAIFALKMVQSAALKLLRKEMTRGPVLQNRDALINYLHARLARTPVEQAMV